MSNNCSGIHPKYIWYNGEFVKWNDANLHVTSHGLHYGTAVFEGLKAYGGHILALSEHSRRLIASAETLGFQIPYSASELSEAMRALVEVNGIGDGYLRPIAWRGHESIGIYAPETTVHTAIAAFGQSCVAPRAARQSGFSMVTSPYRRPAPEAAPVQAKASALYLLGVMARENAAARGYDDALLLDHRGYVAEGTGANIFFIRGDRCVTPIADTFLSGITRRIVIDLARSEGLTVEERRILPEDLAGVEEAFLTGTAYEVQPITSIDDRALPSTSFGDRLARRYGELARAPDLARTG